MECRWTFNSDFSVLRCLSFSLSLFQFPTRTSRISWEIGYGACKVYLAWTIYWLLGRIAVSIKSNHQHNHTLLSNPYFTLLPNLPNTIHSTVDTLNQIHTQIQITSPWFSFSFYCIDIYFPRHGINDTDNISSLLWSAYTIFNHIIIIKTNITFPSTPPPTTLRPHASYDPRQASHSFIPRLRSGHTIIKSFPLLHFIHVRFIR